MKNKLKRLRSIVSRGHVELDGATRVSGSVVVGGDLTVHGDFECAGDLFCMGHVNIQGNLKCGGILLAGCSVEVSNDLNAGYIKVWVGFEDDVGFEDVAAQIIAWMPKPPKEADDVLSAWEYLTDEMTLLELAVVQPYALSVKGDCICGNIDAEGHIHVGGLFNPDSVDALGCPIDAQRIYIDGDSLCGDLSAIWEITIEGDLDCVNVECMRLNVWGSARVEEAISATAPDRLEEDDSMALQDISIFDVECGRDPLEKVAPEHVRSSLDCGSIDAGSVTAAGSIRSSGSISCETYLKANRSIIAGGSITSGKKYGVLAGIGVPRDRWLASGYVCSPEKPPRILTGVYRALSRRRGLYLKPAGLPKPPRLK